MNTLPWRKPFILFLCLLLSILLVTAVLAAEDIDPAPLSMSLRWTWEAERENSYAGLTSMGAVGDLNGDGYDDVCIGATNKSRVFVFYGSEKGLGRMPDWTRADLSSGYGYCDGADVNGDGYQDLIVGAPLRNGKLYDEQGALFVYHGSSAGLVREHDRLIRGFGPTSRFGPVSNAGDINNDGYDDVVVGALWDSGGKAYVFYGSESGLRRVHRSDIYNPNIAGGCAGDDYFGNIVNEAGDVNGDGFADLLIAAPNDKCVLFDEGAVHLYLGSAAGISTTPALTVRGGQIGAHMSYAASGDVNGDGYDDFVAGALRYDQDGMDDRGVARLYLGGPSGPDATPDWTVLGEQADAYLGHGMTGFGDFNGDGYDDVVLSAWNLHDAGRAYVYTGSAAGLSTTPA